MDFLNSTFTLVECLALLGLAQCVLVLVYVLLRVRNWRQASLSIAYFFFLGISFIGEFALRIDDFSSVTRLVIWFARAMGPPLCYLLILQVVKLVDLPEKKHFLILLAVPAMILLALAMQQAGGFCDGSLIGCQKFILALQWALGMVGGICLLLLWTQKHIFSGLWKMKGGRERYWLIMTLLVANVLGVLVSLLSALGTLQEQDAAAIQVTLGIALVYLASTTLFRVYPAPLQLNAVPRTALNTLSAPEKEIAAKVKSLMELDKLYHEPNFSRADLAREIGVSESVLSKVINTAFGRSFPKLLSEFRVEDAKRLLMDRDIEVQVVAAEVGFNSVATFNRVFRELTGETPTAYRASHVESPK